MLITPTALLLIKRSEGFVDHVYLDGAGVPTVGYGTTAADVSPLPRHLTEPQASALLVRQIQTKYAPYVDRLRLPNPNMQAACLSIAYNCGPGILGSGYTLGRALIARDWNAAAAAFTLYVHDIRGNVEPGLVTRRRIEQVLFRKRWVNPDPHHYALFDRTNRHLGGRTMNEHDTVTEYDRDRAHWLKWPRRLKRLRENCGLLAGRIEEVAHEHGGMNIDNRQFRHDGLVGRHNGRRYA